RFHPSAEQLLVGFADRANLFDLGKQIDLLSIRHEDNLILHHAAFSPDGRLLTTAEEDSTLRVWDVPTGRQVREEQGLTRFTSVRFLSEDRLAATGVFGLRIWDV